MDYTNTNYNLHYWIPEDVWIGLTTVCSKVGGGDFVTIFASC